MPITFRDIMQEIVNEVTAREMAQAQVKQLASKVKELEGQLAAVKQTNDKEVK